MHYRPFKSVLIANRGEIACRIVKEARAAGLRSIAVYSDADRLAHHVLAADAAIHIGPSPASESYLSIPKILVAAKATKAEAIHPGYGFLSENPDFAQAVIDAGLVWIGPSPDAIRAMGDKGNAKELARKARVPVIPGYDGDDQSDAKLLSEAKKIGWPVLIKAALGGGGRGQRKVTEESAFLDALASARREALSAFASDRMILEKALENVRHIEVQVFGDSHGNVIHLGERDCSVQRRNQKIIEEAPALGVSEELRNRMGAAAVSLAKAVNYGNAGTVEYLLDHDGKFYFLEMNTRIQVEHPVTEEVTGTNLIQWQFQVAHGMAMSTLVRGGKQFANLLRARGDVIQDAIRSDTLYVVKAPVQNDSEGTLKFGQTEFFGHAIEARLCAEDPMIGFAPQTGTATIGEGKIRIDSAGDVVQVSGHYDSMLAKIIGTGDTRSEAIANLTHQLKALLPAGIRTNRNYLLDLLESPEFQAGRCSIEWLTNRAEFSENNCKGPLASAVAIFLDHGAGEHWRSNGIMRSMITLKERANSSSFVVETFQCNGYEMTSVRPNGNLVRAEMRGPDGVLHSIVARFDENHVHIVLDGRDAIFEDITYAPAERKDAAGAGTIRAPMAGRIVKLNAAPGATVTKGDILVILEAMKMEHELRTSADGTIDTVTIKPGDQVAMRQVLVTLKPV
ncbi:MAG: biotin carboxylase N-terminal domain-containing protein [Micropepsaceae bacterium]